MQKDYGQNEQKPRKALKLKIMNEIPPNYNSIPISLLGVLFKFMDMGINAVPKHSGSEPVGQIRGFPTMLQQ